MQPLYPCHEYALKFFVPQRKDDHLALKYLQLSTKPTDIPPSLSF